jgi:hypothetical protein
MSVILLFVFVICNNLRTENNLIALSSLFIICNPYSVLCSTSIMTEFISMVFVLPCVIVVAHYRDKLLVSFILAFIIGIGIISRLYFIAAIPALFFMFNFNIFYHFQLKSIKEYSTQITFFTICCLPLFFLLYQWVGVSPPNQIISGGITNVGISHTKPLVCVCYIGFYVSFLFLGSFQKINIYILAICIFVGLLTQLLQIDIWNYSNKPISTGMIFKAIHFFSNVYIRNFVSFLFTIYSLYWGITFFKKAISNLLIFQKDYFYIFSVFILLFFVLEQFFIGGTVPFYERYLIIMSIFYGYITIKCMPVLKTQRLFSYFTISLSLSLIRGIYYTFALL